MEAEKKQKRMPRQRKRHLQFRKSRTSEKKRRKAKVFHEDGVMKAELDVDGEKLEKLYPCIAGKILEQKDRKITKFELTTVGLCATPNLDNRIKRLGEQK